MNESLEKFFADQEKRDLFWRPQYWVMSMLAALEIAKAVSEAAVSLGKIAMELRKTRLNLL